MLAAHRTASTYVPAIFGTGRYALLVRPERLPQVLLDRMKCLVVQ